MRIIWKYQFEIEDVVNLRIPVGSELLTVQYQSGVPCAWFNVDNNETEMVDFKLYIFGTGHFLPENIYLEYFATIQNSLMPLVWHIFTEEPEWQDVGIEE